MTYEQAALNLRAQLFGCGSCETGDVTPTPDAQAAPAGGYPPPPVFNVTDLLPTLTAERNRQVGLALVLGVVGGAVGAVALTRIARA
jgi:hypothetical protein